MSLRFCEVFKPPRLPASVASALVNSCAFPSACAALPPAMLSDRCLSGSIAAKPLLVLIFSPSSRSRPRCERFPRPLWRDARNILSRPCTPQQKSTSLPSLRSGFLQLGRSCTPPTTHPRASTLRVFRVLGVYDPSLQS